MKKGMACFLAGLICGTMVVGGSVAYATGVLATPFAQSGQRITLNGTEIQLTGYNINGYNYFKLADMGEKIGFGVAWDGASQTIELTTGEGAASTPSEPTSQGVTLPSDGSRYVPQVGDQIPCDDGSLYTITDVQRYGRNVYYDSGYTPVELPTPTCDWSQFPEAPLPPVEVRRFQDGNSDQLFVRNLYETRRMQYTLYNLMGQTGSHGSVVLTLDQEGDVFWPWRDNELSKLLSGPRDVIFHVEAWDCYNNGIYLHTNYYVDTTPL